MKAKITKRLVESLKPADKIYIVRDSELTGFQLRVRPNGTMTWALDYRNEAGHRLTYRIGKYPGLEPEGARVRAKELAGKVAVGVDVQAQKKAARAEAERSRSATLRGFLDERYEAWALAHIKRGKEHVAALRSNFERWLDEPLSAFNIWRLEGWRRDCLKAGIEPATCNRNISRLRSLLNRAVEWNVIAVNPMKGLKDLKVDNTRLRYLTAAEENKLRDALIAREADMRNRRDRFNEWRRARGKPTFQPRTEEFADHLRPIVLVALNTGARRGELFQLRWRDVNVERKQLTLPASYTKAGTSRMIPLNEEALGILEAWRRQSRGEADALVFPGDDGKGLDNIKKAWAAVVVKAGLRDLHFHDLRHTFASKLVMRQVDLYSVSKLLGHASLKTSERYAHVGSEHLHAAVAKLA